MEQMQNFVLVEGILSEIGLEKATYKKDGKDIECIRGAIKVRVNANNETLEIPVHVFANKFNKAGNPSPLYTNFENFMSTAKSIAAVGLDDADRVRVSGGSVKMNERYTKDGKFLSYPQISTNFITVVGKNEGSDAARADLNGVIYDMYMVTDKNGDVTDTLQISVINIGFNNYADIIPVLVKNPDYVEAIKATYEKGDMVAISTKLNFSSKTEVTYEQVEIGDPIEKKRTINVSELVLAGVKGLDTEYNAEEMAVCMQARTNRLALAKTKAEADNGTKTHTNEIAAQKKTLGF